MAPTTLKSGFYGTNVETYYVTPTGRAWIVQSDDDLGTLDPVEIAADRLPSDARPVDDLVTPEEAIDHCRRIEAVSGEVLVRE